MMTKPEARDTLLRLLETLRQIPKPPLVKSTAEIRTLLEGLGYVVSKRTLQRDLDMLSIDFPIVSDERTGRRTMYWSWRQGAQFELPGIGLDEALSLVVTEEMLRRVLPATVNASLEAKFNNAKSLLNKHQAQNKLASWHKKVRVIPASLPLTPAKLPMDRLATIQGALIHERQLDVAYRGVGQESDREYVLHPLCLVYQGSVPYLLALTNDYTDPRVYSLLRFSRCDISEKSARSAPDFDIDEYICSGAFQHQRVLGKRIRLQALLDPWVARVLSETPLADDQELLLKGDKVRLIATVPDSGQLRYWILSFGAAIEVLKPKSLRGDIAESLLEAAAAYK